MNKSIIVLTILSGFFLAGCSFGWSDTQESSSDTTVLSWGQEEVTPSVAECKQAVEEYLAEGKKATIDITKKVVATNNISVDYIGRLEDGTVFDTSIESIAKACGGYAAGRDYNQGLVFTVGEGGMIAGFDKGVVGMSEKETKTVNIPAAEAYGLETITIPLEQLPKKEDGTEYKAGEEIMTMNGPIKIESMNDKEFTIKNNNPLAWKDLIFDITIKKIN